VRHKVAVEFGDLTAAAISQARGGVLDWISRAIAGSRHKTVTTLLALLRDIFGRPQGTAFAHGLADQQEPGASPTGGGCAGESTRSAAASLPTTRKATIILSSPA
jgi:hypothetical protein